MSGGAASERGKAQEGKGDRTRARALAAWWLERESPQWRTSSGAFFIRPRTSAASCWPHFRSHALVAILRQVWPPSCAWHPPYSLVPSAVSGVGNLVSQAGYRPRRRGLPPRRTQMSVHPCMFRRNAGRGPPQVGPAGRPGGSSDSVPPGVWEVVASDRSRGSWERLRHPRPNQPLHEAQPQRLRPFHHTSRQRMGAVCRPASERSGKLRSLARCHVEYADERRWPIHDLYNGVDSVAQGLSRESILGPCWPVRCHCYQGTSHTHGERPSGQRCWATGKVVISSMPGLHTHVTLTRALYPSGSTRPAPPSTLYSLVAPSGHAPPCRSRLLAAPGQNISSRGQNNSSRGPSTDNAINTTHLAYTVQP